MDLKNIIKQDGFKNNIINSKHLIDLIKIKYLF